MRYIRTQAILALIGLALVASLLFIQSQGLVTRVVPACGGTFSEGVVGGPARFNPLFDSANPAERDVDRLIFSGLMKFDSSGRPTPDLARSYAVSADGLSYTFVLQDGLRWHDGAAVSDQDVLFTVGLLQAADYPGPRDVSAFWQKVQVMSPSRNTVRFTLPEPFAPFLDYTTVGLLPQHLLHDQSPAQLLNSAFNTDPVGAGPMKLSAIERTNGVISSVTLDSTLSCANNQNYLHQVRFRYYSDAAAAHSAFDKGEVLALSSFTPQGLAATLADPKTAIFTGRLSQYDLIFMNQKAENLAFFQEKKVRQALLLGINRQRIVDQILNGQALVATGPVLPGSWAYKNDLTPAAFDPQAAADGLAEAGWLPPSDAIKGTPQYVRSKKGLALKFKLTYPDDALHKTIAQVLAADWAGIGVQASLEALTPAQVKAALEARTFEAAMIDLNFSRTPDPDPYPFWHQTQIENGQNYSAFNNRIMSEILEQARIIPSYTDRAKFYRAFQSQFNDQTPALLLYYPVFTYAVNSKVHGVQIGPLVDPSDRFNNLSDWYLLTRRVIENANGP
jgi:peptide/nickel transport system substrate-binding protein